MAHQYRVTKEYHAGLQERLDDLHAAKDSLVEDLRNEAQAHRDAFDEAGERWQDSDRGQEVDGWISALEELADDLDGAIGTTIPQAPGDEG